MNLFKIMQGIRSLAQAGKIDYPGAIQYLNQLGVEMDGIVKQALDNVFKKGKARDPNFGDTVVKMQIDEQGIPFNPNTLKSTTEKRGVGNLFQNKSKTLADELAEAEGVETFETILPTKSLKEPKYGKLDYDRIAKMEGVDVEEIRGKSFREIIEYLAAVRDKADGGRVGYANGGLNLSGEAQNIYNSWVNAGHTHQEALDYLSSRGMYETGGGGGGVESIINTQQSIIPGAGGDNIPTGPESYTQTWTSEGLPAAKQTQPIELTATEQAWREGPFYGPTQKQYQTPRTIGDQVYAQSLIDKETGIKTLGVPPARTGVLGMWDKTKDFFSGLGGSPKVRGELGTRLANQPRLPLPVAMASWSLSPFNIESRNYNPNFVDQLNFLEMQDGMIGRDQSGHLKYGPDSVLAGKNVISLFGSNNYEAALDKEIERLEGILEKNKNKWDATKIASWKAKFLDPAYLERQKANKEFADKVEAERQAALQKKIADEAMKGKTLSQIGREQFTGEGQAFAPRKDTYTGGKTVKSASTPGGYYSSPRKDGGLMFAQGGLATMFTRRR